MKELQRKSLATAEFDEILGSHVYSVHDLQGFQIDVLWLCIYFHHHRASSIKDGLIGLEIGNVI